jgi:predicted DNA-binding transcriptional regulator AlpA
MEKSEVSSGESLRLINLDAVARWLGVSHRHIYRLVDRGAMPKPVRLGVAVRWDSEVIRSWIDSGCPAVEPRKKRPR